MIKVFYDEQEVKGSPFTVNVYDISYARIIRHAFGPIQLREPYQFQSEYQAVPWRVPILLKKTQPFQGFNQFQMQVPTSSKVSAKPTPWTQQALKWIPTCSKVSTSQFQGEYQPVSKWVPTNKLAGKFNQFPSEY